MALKVRVTILLLTFCIYIVLAFALVRARAVFDLGSNICPVLTFKYGVLPSATNGIPGGLVAVALSLIASVASIFGILKYKVTRAYLGISTISLVALLLSVGYFFDEAAHVFCLTPSEVLVHPGFMERPQSLSWDNLKVVTARCWAATGRSPRNLGSTLELQFSGEEPLPFGLVDSGRILLDEYRRLRETLKGRDYRFVLDETVVSASCPPGIYPALLRWKSE